MFAEEEFTIEEIINYLKITEDGVKKLKELNLIYDLKLLFANDNDLSICRADLKNVFYDKEIIGNIILNDNNLIIDTFNNKIAKDIIFFLLDSELDKRDIQKYEEMINKKISYNCNFLFGFKKSKSKRIIGLIMG